MFVLVSGAAADVVFGLCFSDMPFSVVCLVCLVLFSAHMPANAYASVCHDCVYNRSTKK